MIGGKEGATKAITEKVGSKITEIILRTTDGNDFKEINNYELHKIVTTAISGADRRATNNVLEQLADVIGYQFNFQKK